MIFMWQTVQMLTLLQAAESTIVAAMTVVTMVFIPSMWVKMPMYITREKHYGEGNGTGSRVLNPVTNIELGENSVFTLDTVQIKGVDSTIRTTNVSMDADSKLFVLERLMTDGEQKAESDIEVCMNGAGSSAQIISRSVGKGNSSQVFHPKAVGKNKCHAHIQCDSIIMDHAEVGSIPEIQAKHVDAAIVHEAAIGRINDEQLLKLRTLGMTEAEAENCDH